MSLVKGLKYRDTYKKFDISTLAHTIEQAYVINNQRPGGFKQKKSFAPSGVGYGNGTCARYWWYAFQGAEFMDGTVDALGIAGMEYGTDAHARIQRTLKEADLLLEEETEILHNDPPIKGFMDALIKWQGDEVPVEIKTTRQEMFVYRETTMEPPFYNLLQLLIYMKVLGKQRGLLLYENKNSQELLVLPVEMDEKNTKIIDEAFEWMRTVHANAMSEEGSLPTRPFTKASKFCKNCPVSDICWADEVGTLTIPVLGGE